MAQDGLEPVPVKNDGGPAFPSGGITVRQFYKGIALLGLFIPDEGSDQSTPVTYVDKAAELADAMIDEDEIHQSESSR